MHWRRSIDAKFSEFINFFSGRSLEIKERQRRNLALDKSVHDNVYTLINNCYTKIDMFLVLEGSFSVIGDIT